MKLPETATYIRVDEIIECMEVSKECEKALLEAMPDAYGGTPPGEDDWPEPDSSRDDGYRLSDCWDKLPEHVQKELTTVFNNRYR